MHRSIAAKDEERLLLLRIRGRPHKVFDPLPISLSQCLDHADRKPTLPPLSFVKAVEIRSARRKLKNLLDDLPRLFRLSAPALRVENDGEVVSLIERD